jgi:hypothetical protein
VALAGERHRVGALLLTWLAKLNNKFDPTS